MVKRLLNFLLVLILLIILAGAAGLWALHHYIQSPEFKAKLSQEISKTLNRPTQLTQLKFNFLTGFELQNVQIANQTEATPPFLQIQQVKLAYTPVKLFEKQLFVNELSLIQPDLRIQFNADGSSNIPKITKPETSLPAPSDSPLSIDTDALQLDVILDQFNLSDGQIVFLNPDDAVLFSTKNANIHGRYELLPRGARAQGKIQINQLTLGSNFNLQGVTSSITYADGKLILPDIIGQAYEGTASGLSEVNFSGEKPSFSLQLNLDDVQLAQLMKDFGSSSDEIHGALYLSTSLEGSLLQPKLLTGKGDLEIRGIDFSKFELLRTIAQLLSISELAQAEPPVIKGTFKVGDQKITFFNLETATENVQISAGGSLTFDRQADFDVLLALHEKLAKRIPAQIQNQLTKREDGFYTITFKVSGQPGNLKTNLIEKLAQGTAQTVIQSFHRDPEKTLNKPQEILHLLQEGKPLPPTQQSEPAPRETTPASEKTSPETPPTTEPENEFLNNTDLQLPSSSGSMFDIFQSPDPALEPGQ